VEAVSKSIQDVEGFYRALLHELGEHAYRGGTAYGAAAVAKRVAREWGYGACADRLPLPRPTRRKLEENGRLGSSFRRTP
jgi:hypothetical protein